MGSKNSPAKSSNTQNNAQSGPVPSIRQLTLWEQLAEATRVLLEAELWMLFEDLDSAIDSLTVEEQILVAGEGIAQMGEIVSLRAEMHLQEINYLLYPQKEPVLPLDGFVHAVSPWENRYVRQSMVVDLEQFCAEPELPEVERGYVRSVVEPMGEEEAIAEVMAAIHEKEPESPLELAHDEDIGGWSAKIENCLVGCGGAIGFWAIVEVTGLAPVEVLLGLLLGGLAIDWEAEGDFYGGVVVRF